MFAKISRLKLPYLFFFFFFFLLDLDSNWFNTSTEPGSNSDSPCTNTIFKITLVPLRKDETQCSTEPALIKIAEFGSVSADRWTVSSLPPGTAPALFSFHIVTQSEEFSRVKTTSICGRGPYRISSRCQLIPAPGRSYVLNSTGTCAEKDISGASHPHKTRPARTRRCSRTSSRIAPGLIGAPSRPFAIEFRSSDNDIFLDARKVATSDCRKEKSRGGRADRL
mmetsp:Transcript_50753/g.99207  ORF Transcript_50753/g.99207 Transcript_50753/m.99207 type:complete len:223 (+) Transcript_50753:34-702(+)